MLSKRRLNKTIFLVCLLHYVLTCAGQSGVTLHVRRHFDGDVFTRFISSANDSSCDSWFALNVQPFSKENCSVQCKCRATKKTYNITGGTCVADEDILKIANCNGSFLPSSEEPLYDLSKPGKAQLNVSFFNNQSYCRIATMTYLNETNEVSLAHTSGFNISRNSNGSAVLTWVPLENLVALSKLQPFGFLLKVRLLCNEVTSQQQRSCFVIKARGGIKNIDPTSKEHRKIQDICKSKGSKNSANVMLLYILVGFGCGLVLVVVVVVSCYACYKRRSGPSTRHGIPRILSRGSGGTKKAFKARSVTKNNEPTTPAIHDVIFNELSWDTDGGFSNRALADPKVLDVDYGIPIDFGTLPRLESSTSIDSNRNSLSPLTDIGERRQTRT